MAPRVAPYTGARIETADVFLLRCDVAPYTGARIETMLRTGLDLGSSSPLHGGAD